MRRLLGKRLTLLNPMFDDGAMHVRMWHKQIGKQDVVLGIEKGLEHAHGIWSSPAIQFALWHRHTCEVCTCVCHWIVAVHACIPRGLY